MTNYKVVSIATNKNEYFQWCFFTERVSPKVSGDTKSISFDCFVEAVQTKISKQINKIYENICKAVTIATGNWQKPDVTAKVWRG